MTELDRILIDSEATLRFYRAFNELEDLWKWIKTTWKWRNYLWYQYQNRRKQLFKHLPPICHAGYCYD